MFYSNSNSLFSEFNPDVHLCTNQLQSREDKYPDRLHNRPSKLDLFQHRRSNLKYLIKFKL